MTRPLLAAFPILGMLFAAAQAPAVHPAAMEDALGKLWAWLRVATPRADPVIISTAVTAGLRGSEATESGLGPYWNGDHE